jgi:hypothetical protein
MLGSEIPRPEEFDLDNIIWTNLDKIMADEQRTLEEHMAQVEKEEKRHRKQFKQEE